mmetsp:Transcript_16175/g.54554  ORF Transcript_16175/g.54554 Transcript_16175/m.54554 type:complete len:255 (+) Transcript_16175:2501-3265(+)
MAARSEDLPPPVIPTTTHNWPGATCRSMPRSVSSFRPSPDFSSSSPRSGDSTAPSSLLVLRPPQIKSDLVIAIAPFCSPSSSSFFSARASTSGASRKASIRWSEKYPVAILLTLDGTCASTTRRLSSSVNTVNPVAASKGLPSAAARTRNVAMPIKGGVALMTVKMPVKHFKSLLKMARSTARLFAIEAAMPFSKASILMIRDPCRASVMSSIRDDRALRKALVCLAISLKMRPFRVPNTNMTPKAPTAAMPTR